MRQKHGTRWRRVAMSHAERKETYTPYSRSDTSWTADLVLVMAHVSFWLSWFLPSWSGLISPTNQAYVLPSVLRFLRDQAYQLRASPKTCLEVVYPLLLTGIEILLKKIPHSSFYTIITLKKRHLKLLSRCGEAVTHYVTGQQGSCTLNVVALTRGRRTGTSRWPKRLRNKSCPAFMAVYILCWSAQALGADLSSSRARLTHC